MRPKSGIGGLILPLFLIIRITGGRASCPSGYVYLQARAGEVRNLTSPNYPENYGNHQNCRWMITAPEQYVVHLRVVDLWLEENSMCRYDNLSISNAGDVNTNPQGEDTGTEVTENHSDDPSRLAVLCGLDHGYRHFYSSGRSLVISFKSDGSVSYRGFQLEYSAVRPWDVPTTTTPKPSTTTRRIWGSCPREYMFLDVAEDETKFLTSPHYPSNYYNNQICKWRITAPQQYVVHLHVVDLVIENNTACKFDNLSFYEGEFPHSLLTTLCGSGHNAQDFYSSGRSVDVIFKSDMSVTYRGFQLEYSAVRSWDIPTTTTARPSTTTTTRRPPYSLYAHPYDYANLHWSISNPSSYVSSRWRIWCDDNYSIQLYVLDMNLQSSSNCDEVKVTIYDTDETVLAQMCSSDDAGKFLYSTGTVMYVRVTGYVRDYRSYRKFTLRYKAQKAYSGSSGSSDSSSSNRFNYVLLAAGVTGSFVLFVFIGMIIRVCTRNRSTTSGRQARPGAGANRSTGVYVVPVGRQQQGEVVGGHTNLAFSQEPPPYSSLHHPDPNLLASAPPLLPLGDNGLEMAPPSYTEAMMMSHPPAGYKVEQEDDPTQRTQSEVATGPPPPPPPPLLTSAAVPYDPQGSAMFVGSNPPAAEASGVAEAAVGGHSAAAAAVAVGPAEEEPETHPLVEDTADGQHHA